MVARPIERSVAKFCESLPNVAVDVAAANFKGCIAYTFLNTIFLGVFVEELQLSFIMKIAVSS
jgi:hypothetical protein